MDRIGLQAKISTLFDKYKYVLLVVILGLILMVWPTKNGETQMVQPPVQPTQEIPITQELCEILGQIRGVGRVRVMLTEQSGSQTHYQTDTSGTQTGDSSTHDSRTVMTTSGGTESGLITSVSPPIYLGAIVVCQGGDDPSVRLAVSQAVSSVTGISTDRISVLKMK